MITRAITRSRTQARWPLHRAETEPAYLKRLAAQCRKRAPLFRPARERRAWRRLLAELSNR